MAQPLRLLVIGGVAAGTKAASKARRDDPSMEITIVTDEPYVSYVACDLAYYIGGVIERRESLFARSPEAFRDEYAISLLLNHRAESVDTRARAVTITNLEGGGTSVLPYDRLLIATGSHPIIPDIPGIDRMGVYPLHTVTDADAIKERLESSTVRRACILGGGFIGIEMAENLLRRGVEVTIFEQADRLMAGLYDPDMSARVREQVESHGVSVRAGVSIERFTGDGEVRSVIARGTDYPCELAIIATGVQPSVALAQDAGIDIGTTGAIAVNERMETSVRDVYAAGDCAESVHLVSRKPYWFPLGSTANKQGRVAGANIAGDGKTFAGVLGTSILKVFDTALGRTGLNEREARESGFDPVSVTVSTPTIGHSYPGGGSLTLTLTADRGSRRLLGAQAFGDGTVDKVIDTVVTALTGNVTVSGMTNLDLAYSPPFASALGTVIVAAEVMEKKLGI